MMVLVLGRAASHRKHGVPVASRVLGTRRIESMQARRMLRARLMSLLSLLLLLLMGCAIGDDEFERYERGVDSRGAAGSDAAAYTKAQAMNVTCPEARKAGAFAVSYSQAGVPDEADRLLATVAAYCPEKADDFVLGARSGVEGLPGDERLAGDFAEWLEERAR